MKKIVITSLLALSAFMVTGCMSKTENKGDIIIQNNSSDNNYGKNEQSDLTFNYSDNEIIEGGENGRIRGYYQFNNYEEFSLFYSLFKKNNSERYLIPNDSNKDLTFEYAFLSEGVFKKYFDEKKYDIIFPNQTMFLNIMFGGIEIKGTCFNINALDRDATLNLTYEIKERSNKSYEFLITSRENYAVFKAIVKSGSEIKNISEICEIIIFEFEKVVI